MVARLKPGASIRKSFFYNETKVEEGKATCLHAENYPRELTDLDQHMRLAMLKKLAALRPSVKVNSLHISLNFDPSEKISADTYVQIAKTYMEKIGFGNQPYLVYEHYDAAHPHIHIVTTNVESEHTAINLHHLGIRASEPARKEIEELFNLVRAEGQKPIDYALKPLPTERLNYGKRETKKAMSHVLETLVKSYNYASLTELNALLKQYNITADRGGEDSRIYRHNGLLYRMLDDQGKPIGVPIKASAFHFKPTLGQLKKRFKSGSLYRKPHRNKLKQAIDLYFLKHKKQDIHGFCEALKQAGIAVVLRQNEQGKIYGITYVDHRHKCVFNGSDLGKEYSPKGLAERMLTPVPAPDHKLLPTLKRNPIDLIPAIPLPAMNLQVEALLELWLGYENVPHYMPYELTGKKKKKRRKKKSTND